jgi:hypothetical protein
MQLIYDFSVKPTKKQKKTDDGYIPEDNSAGLHETQLRAGGLFHPVHVNN